MMKETKISTIRKMKPGQVLEITGITAFECESYHSTAWRFNRLHGKGVGVYIHTAIDYDACSIWLVCTSYDDYVKEKDKTLPPKWWKKFIKKKRRVLSDKKQGDCATAC